MFDVCPLSTVKFLNVHTGKALGVFCGAEAGVVGQRVGVSPSHVY